MLFPPIGTKRTDSPGLLFPMALEAKGKSIVEILAFWGILAVFGKPPTQPQGNHCHGSIAAFQSGGKAQRIPGDLTAFSQSIKARALGMKSLGGIRVIGSGRQVCPSWGTLDQNPWRLGSQSMSTVLRFRISFEQKLLLGLDSETIIDSLVDKLNMLKSLHICGNNYDSLYAILYLDVQLPDENPKEAEFRILDLLSEPDLLRYSQFFRQDYDDWESESYG